MQAFARRPTSASRATRASVSVAKPFFVLVLSGADTTLLMPRDGRVMCGASPASIVEALAGVALGPDDLRAIADGCGLESGPPRWRPLVSERLGGARCGRYIGIRPSAGGPWRVVGATRGGLTVTYADTPNAPPARVVLITSTAAGRTAAELTLRLSDVETNPSLDDRVFVADVPQDALPISIDELRRAGPLGEKSGDDQSAARWESIDSAAFVPRKADRRDAETQRRRTEEKDLRLVVASRGQSGSSRPARCAR